MYVKVKGIVALETDFSENDKYIDILTYTHGKISVFCKGVRKKGSKLSNKVRLFNYGEFDLFYNKGKYSLNDANLIESFFSLTSDIDKFALCSYFLQVSSKFCLEDDEKVVRTLIASLYAVSKFDKDIAFVKSVFEFRVMCDVGFMPILEKCYVCLKDTDIHDPAFDIENGSICCSSCISGENIVNITNGVLKTIYHIATVDVKKLYSFEIKGRSFDILCDISEKYLLSHTGYNFKTLDFFKSLRI